jgi:hypothetical protein
MAGRPVGVLCGGGAAHGCLAADESETAEKGSVVRKKFRVPDAAATAARIRETTIAGGDAIARARVKRG